MRLPASTCKSLVSIAISEAVRLDLLAPVVGVVRGPRGVVGTAVPEATVYEDHKPDGTKDDVRATAAVREYRPVNAKSETACMKQPAKHQLWLRIATAGARHALADDSRRRTELRSLRARERQATASWPCGVIASR